MAACWRTGGISNRKHGIGGHVSPNSRQVQEAARMLERGRRKRSAQRMYGSIRELFSNGRRA